MKQIRHCMPQWFNCISTKSYDKRSGERSELMRILQKGEKAGRSLGQNYALVALKQFYMKLNMAKVEKQYFIRSAHLSYLWDIIKIKEALLKRDYVWTCHELCDIIHNEDIFQNRIKCNITDLLRTCLKAEGAYDF